MPGKITRDSIDAVRMRSDILAVVGEYVQLERRGSLWWGCCPFHNEKTPSFCVTPDRGIYHCFGCKKHGNVISFVEEMEGIPFPEAVDRLAKQFSVELKYEEGTFVPDEGANLNKKYIELYTRVAGTFHYMLTNTEAGKFALDYIKGRGISDEIIERFNLGYSPGDRYYLRKFLRSKNFSDEFLDGSGLFSRNYKNIAFFSDRLMFPITDKNGNVVAFGGRFLRGNMEHTGKYMNSTDLPWYQKGEILYGFSFARQAIRQKRKVIFCEGYMDCIAYHQCGVDYAVAPLGTALTESQIRLVKNIVDEVILSFDSDGAGQAATKRAILMCRSQGIPTRVVHLNGGKDPAEIMILFGKEHLTEAVESSIFDFEHLVMTLKQSYPVDTPEGKARIAKELFDYVDALQSDIQKESTLGKIAVAIGLSTEAVSRDFYNRSELNNRLASYSALRRQNEKGEHPDGAAQVKPDAELRTLLAVIADMNLFETMKAELGEDDFENPLARRLFTALKECHEEGDVSLDAVESRCQNDVISNLVEESVMSGEYSMNTEQSVKDGIRMMKRKTLIRRRQRLQDRLSEIQSSAHDGEELVTLFEEIMAVDKMLRDNSF